MSKAIRLRSKPNSLLKIKNKIKNELLKKEKLFNALEFLLMYQMVGRVAAKIPTVWQFYKRQKCHRLSKYQGHTAVEEFLPHQLCAISNDY